MHGAARIRSQLLSAIKLLRDAVLGFIEDGALTLSASLAFYPLLSFAPLTVLSVWAASSLGTGAQEAFLQQIQAWLGDEARETVTMVIQSASRRPSLGSAAGFLGILVSLVGATTVFAQLQSSLNII